MKKTTNSKKLLSVNPETIRAMQLDTAGPAVAGGTAYTQLYYSCRACGSLTKFC